MCSSLFAMKGKQNEAAVLKPEGEALLIRTVLGRLGAAGGAEGGAHVEPSGRRRGGKRVGGAAVGDRMMLACAAGVRGCRALRVVVYGRREGCARIPRSRLYKSVRMNYIGLRHAKVRLR
jgi:hypothetical protein